MKADDKVKYNDEDVPSKFTNFEEMAARVKVLQETLDEHAEIFRQHSMKKIVKTQAPYFDEDEVYNRLEEDTE